MVNKKHIVIVLAILLVSSLLLLSLIYQKKESFEMKARVDIAEREEKNEAKKQEEMKAEQGLDLSLLKEEIKTYLAKEEIDEADIGLYVIDLEDDQSIGINENKYFYAASTYKLPLAMLWYDKLEKEEGKSAMALLFQEDEYEEGGHIGTDYEFGSMIDVEELLEAMIVESDNSAAHILYEELGGWTDYKKQLKTYDPSQAMDEKYLSYDNEFTPKNMGRILKYLYEHQGQYKKLIKDMKASMPGRFLDADLNIYFPQKYGSYDYSYNAVGVSLQKHPYAIVIDTMLGDYGEVVIGEINKIVYDFFNEGQ